MAEPMKNIVLVGRTGNGKSATGNSLLGQTLFKSGKLAVGVTKKCEMYRAAINDGPLINVIDTPGLFDFSESDDYINKEIISCLTMAEEGIHAVLLVLSARGRVSKEEESTLNTLQCLFDSKILDYFIVVFTGGDEFDGNQTLDDYFSAGCPEFLTNVLRLCGERKVLFNNTTTDKNKKAGQLKQLLDLVADVDKQTGGIPYTYQMHRKIKEANEKLMEQERAKNRSEAELAVLEEKLQREQKKLQIEEEKNKQLIAHAEEEKRSKEQQMNERKKRRMVCARDLNFEGFQVGKNHWRWVNLEYETTSDTSVEVAELLGINWLDVGGVLDTREMAPYTHYEVVFLVRLKNAACGWETPVKLKLAYVHRGPGKQERLVDMREHIGKGWVTIPAGEFITTPENVGEIRFSLFEVDGGKNKEGLIIKGVLIRPIN